MKLLGRTAVFMLALLGATACGSDPTSVLPLNGQPQTEISPPSLPVPIAPLQLLSIPTYESSGQAVHPDVIRFAQPWHGWEYWMAVTPFPQGKETFENPSILVSHDGNTWVVPSGLRNPLAPTPHMAGYNSDPDLNYDAARNQLILIYRGVSSTENLIYSMTSADGVQWSRPHLVFRRPNHGIVSPTVTFGPSGLPTMWYVDAGPKRCSERVTRMTMQTAKTTSSLTTSATETGWTAPRRIDFKQPGHNIWHVDVTWVPEKQEYWAVYIAYPGYNCWGEDLYFARSSDGVVWTTYAIPFLRHQDAIWTSSTLYRASVMYDATRDVVQFYVSAEGPTHAWQLGFVEYRLQSFLASLSGAVTPFSSTVEDVPLSARIAFDKIIEP